MTHKTATRRHNCHVMVPLSPDQRSRVQALAEAEDRSMASVCRRFVEQGLAKAEARIQHFNQTQG